MEQDMLKELNRINLVTQSNSLVEARYALTKNEQLILCAMISFINPNDEEFLTFKTSISQFLTMLNVDKKSGNREMKRVIKRLLSRVIEIETPDGWKMYQWCSYAEANTKEDFLLLCFHPKLKPYLLELKGRFTSFKLDDVIDLKSFYSIRFYQLLKDYDGRKKSVFSYLLVDLREILLGRGSKKYPVFKDFRRNILDVAKNELDKKSPLSFTFESIRIGRRIGQIQFTVVKKQQLIATDSKQAEVIEIPEVNAMIAIGITRKKALSITNNYSIEYINEKLQMLLEKQKIATVKNPSGFVVKAITDNWKTETKMLTVPNLRDGTQLQTWALSKGLPAAPAGFETLQYYRMLCNHVEKMNSAQEREEQENLLQTNSF
jgi:plasmid replication initiation protein